MITDMDQIKVGFLYRVLWTSVNVDWDVVSIGIQEGEKILLSDVFMRKGDQDLVEKWSLDVFDVEYECTELGPPEDYPEFML